jgi:hypothetical protein
VDHAITGAGACDEARSVREIAVVRFDTHLRQAGSGGGAARQPHDSVSRALQFGHDGSADEAGGASYENAHAELLIISTIPEPVENYFSIE